MRNSNGQNPKPEPNKDLNLPPRIKMISKPLYPSQLKFIEFIMLHDLKELIRSMKLIHDLALYHSNVPIKDEEKTALYSLKNISAFIEEIEAEVKEEQ